MKIIFLVYALSFSFPLLAGSDYVAKAKGLINKMVAVKQQKIKIITDAEKLPPKERACEIQRALRYYKDNLVPLAQELSALRDANFQKGSNAEEAEIDREKQSKWDPIANDEQAMEKAAREIDVTLCQ